LKAIASGNQNGTLQNTLFWKLMHRYENAKQCQSVDKGFEFFTAM
jgi:hypothetical protein